MMRNHNLYCLFQMLFSLTDHIYLKSYQNHKKTHEICVRITCVIVLLIKNKVSSTKFNIIFSYIIKYNAYYFKFVVRL